MSRSITRFTAKDEEVDQRPLDFRLIQRLLEFTQPYAKKRTRLLTMVLLRSIQLPLLTWIVAAVINGPVEQHDMPGVIWGSIAFAVLMISAQVVLHYRYRWALELGEAVVVDLRNAVFEHLQQQPLSWFQKTKVGRIISRMTSDIEDVRVGVQDILFISLVQLGQMFVAAACMLWYDWQLFLLVLLSAPVIWSINRQFHRRLSDTLRAMRRSFSRITATLAESVVGIRVTQSFVRQEENAVMFRELAIDHSRYNSAVMRTQGLFLPLLDFCNQAFIALILVVGGYRALSPEHLTSVGDLVGFFFMANLFFAPVSILGNQYNQAMTAMAAAERLFALLDSAPEWTDAADAEPLPKISGRVEFENVSFGYDPERPVLHEINFVAQPGETIALVGHTGSGKTSIVNLIAKFYPVTTGRVLIDGHDIAQVQSPSLQRQLGIVVQQNFLFDGTIAENIRVGRPQATDDEVMGAVCQLGCLDLITNLKHGFQTHVGERGAQLSAGQRQIICFARALLANPRILILDEATSCLDSQTESRLQTALEVLLAGRTSFVIAHRLSTIRHADQVLVLDHGRIIERGCHEELLALGGTYAHMHDQFVRAA